MWPLYRPVACSIQDIEHKYTVFIVFPVENSFDLTIVVTVRFVLWSEETNCLVAEYRIPYRIGPRTIITHVHRAPVIDGLGHATWSAKASTYLSQAS